MAPRHELVQICSGMTAWTEKSLIPIYKSIDHGHYPLGSSHQWSPQVLQVDEKLQSKVVVGKIFHNQATYSKID
jgi:hypothetical protein